jgi:FHA domain-containing protein
MADETLKITGGNAAGQDITLEQELVIGRSTPGLGSLGGDSEISRAHARVFHDPSGRLMIEDLGSTNGTFVNGNRISAQQALNPGDEVRVGQTTMSVEGGGAAGATTVGNIVPAPAPVPTPTPAPEPPTQALPPQQPAFSQQPPAGPPPPGYGAPQRSGGGGGPSRNLLIALAAALLIALVVAGLAIGGVFGGDDDKKSDTNTTAQTTTSPTVAMPEPPTTDTTPSSPSKPSSAYPPGFRKRFVDSCESGGAPRSICGCTYDKLKARYTFPEFVSLLGKVKGSNLPGPVRDAVQQCARS